MCRHARVYGHTTTVIYDKSTLPPVTWLAVAFGHFVNAPRRLGLKLRPRDILFGLTNPFGFQLSGQAGITGGFPAPPSPV